MNPRKIMNLILLLTIVFCFSCKQNKKRDGLKKIVREWISKEIQFSDRIPCYRVEKDTIISIIDRDLSKAEYKILLYVDSTGCSECRLLLHKWLPLITEAGILYSNRLEFAFFFQPKNMEEIYYLFRLYDFNYPVYIDEKNEIFYLNNLPREEEYQCFLLDRNNRVLALGNPVHNPKIWELYKKIINDNENE
jgi:hypothetical protein